MKQEIWKDVPNYEGLYQVSNLGIVKSLTRTVSYNDGRKSKRKGRTLSYVIRHGYPSVSIFKNLNMTQTKLFNTPIASGELNGVKWK